MRIEDLNSDLVEIAEKKMALGRLSYSDRIYDALEEELHALEDAFVEQHGPHLEAVLAKVHEKHCPETEVLSPLAYLAKTYLKVGTQADGTAVYDIPDFQQGIVIDSDHYSDAHLVLVPNPVRILLTAPQENIREEVWPTP
ncbi:MAG: hypothetical protein HC880_18380 [Bacteroidia bacterium]|nr:hypothetical protein [Bacteroidia bacterium]